MRPTAWGSICQSALILTFSVLGLASAFQGSAVRAEDLSCLKDGEASSLKPVTWYSYLQQQAISRLADRQPKVDALQTEEAVKAYQSELHRFMTKQLGGFPEKTPLNGVIVGRIPCDGYEIEKVIYESQPNHHVTANLYRPLGAGPFPAVLVASGHSRTAKTADYNQRMAISLAENGMIALCYDPIGQGERSQWLSEKGTPAFDGTTTEHFMVGAGSIVVGRNTATYRIWDAMRSVDYLESRSDVRADRIGMTGCSGGGTLTSYVMALDKRIACAAPACYLTTFSHLITALGPQDAEQNIFGQISFGLDHPDYVLMRTPKPTLISSTTGDYFPIDGAWANFRQAKRIYARLGASERVDLVEADGTHGVQPANLAAITQWFRRWLVGVDRPVALRDFSKFSTRKESELLCTPRGQVMLLEGQRSVYDLNATEAKRLERTRREGRNSVDSALRDRVLSSLNWTEESLREVSKTPVSSKAGKVERDGYHIDKLVIHSRSGVPLPALTYHPKDPADAAYVYLHDDGKAADGMVGGPIEKLVKEGFVVVSIDLRGQGETASGKPDPRLGDWKTFYLAYLLGESVVAIHTEDILQSVTWTTNYQSQKPRDIHLIAKGRTAVAALHAVALQPTLFTTVELIDAPQSWMDVAAKPEQSKWLTSTIHGVLESYDLPELRNSIPAGKLKQN